MRTTSLDILERAQLPGSQAKAILTVMELELEDHRQGLATHADVATLRAEMAGIKTELKIDIANLRTEFGDLKTELKSEIRDSKVDMIRWMIATNTIFLSLGLGVVYFFLNHIHH